MRSQQQQQHQQQQRLTINKWLSLALSLVLLTAPSIITAFTADEVEAGLIYSSLELAVDDRGSIPDLKNFIHGPGSDPTASNIHGDCEEYDPNFVSDFVEDPTPIDWDAVLRKMNVP